jgi:glycosyltransferase involved in cell wall biosynthesis
MKVVINALSQVGAGSRTYLSNVLPRLTRMDPSTSYTILWPGSEPWPADVSNRGNLTFVEVNLPQKPAILRLSYEQVVMPFLADGGDILFAPVDVGPVCSSVPLVLAIRNPNPFFDVSSRPLITRISLLCKRALISLSARRAAKVIFVSEYSRSHIVPQIGVPAARTLVIYHGIDHHRFNSEVGLDCQSSDGDQPARRYILCVSTITWHKNFEVLLKGYAMLPESLRADYDLVMAGRVAVRGYHERLKRLVTELGVDNSVHFLGEYPYDRIETLYKGASVYVLPSLLETFGHTLVEAMASGLPIIASRISCIPEIVGEAGLLFDPYSPEELTSRLASVLSEDGTRTRLVRAGQLRSKDFSWDKTTQGLVELFHSLGE